MTIKPLLPPVTPPIIPVKPVLPETQTTGILFTIGAYAAILGVFFLALFLMLKGMKKEMKISMPLALLIGGGIGLSILLLFGTTLTAVKGLILELILFYASLSDLGKREVPNCVSVMIFILAFVGFDSSRLPSMLIGAAAVFLPQILISAILPKKGLGGADIKISTALAFLFGVEKGIFALIVGLLVGVVVELILRKLKKVGKDEAFPLVPFLGFGAMLAFYL